MSTISQSSDRRQDPGYQKYPRIRPSPVREQNLVESMISFITSSKKIKKRKFLNKSLLVNRSDLKNKKQNEVHYYINIASNPMLVNNLYSETRFNLDKISKNILLVITSLIPNTEKNNNIKMIG